MSRLNRMVVPAATLLRAGCGADAALAPAAMSRSGTPASALPVSHGTVVYQAAMRVDPPGGAFTLAHAMLDFQPGTWFPAHVHPGPVLYTIVEGGVTVFDDGVGSEYEAGESYGQDPGQVLAAGNLGTTPALMAVAFVLPDGGELVTFHPDHSEHAELPFPEISHLLETELLSRPVQFTIVQLVLDLEPERWAPARAHPGPSLVTVLSGEVVLRRPGGEERVVGAGDGWSLAGTEQAQVRPGPAGARLVGTYLVP